MAKLDPPTVELLSSSNLESIDREPPIVARPYEACDSEALTVKTQGPEFDPPDEESVTTPAARSSLPPVPKLPERRGVEPKRPRVASPAPRLPPPARAAPAPRPEAPARPEAPERESVAPVTTIARPRARSGWSDARLGRAAIMGGVVGALAFMVFVLGGALAKAASGQGERSALIVTAAGAGGAPIPEPSIYADGALRCTTTPCRLELAAGTHLVSVSAPGYLATAPHAIDTPEHSERAVHFELRERAVSDPDRDCPPPRGLVAREPEPAPSEPAPPPFSLVPGRDETAPPAPPPHRGSAALPAFAPSASLNLNAIPIARVVLDGRPLGSTPKLGVRVPAGTHQILFLNADGQRQARVVDVEAGAIRTVAVRF